MKVAEVKGVLGSGSVRNKAYLHLHTSLVFFRYLRNHTITIDYEKIIAIGAIIQRSLSYALQLSSAGFMCNAERFDNKAGPFVASIMETILRMQW